MAPKTKPPPVRSGAVSRQKIARQQHLRVTASAPKLQASADRLRLQHLAARLHALGPKPLFHFLHEAEQAGADLRPALEAYAALDPDFIRAHGGDQFEPFLFSVDGGKR